MMSMNGTFSGSGGKEEDRTPTPIDEKRSTAPPGILRDPALLPARKLNTDIPHILPHERVFPIQIGQELFRLSGASISSDAPSYFSEFFGAQLRVAKENGDDPNAVRTLYIDRDPVTFKDISLHLQGYHVSPRDGSHFVKLFADAQFYSLPRLMSQLYEDRTFISIGNRDFQIPRDLFNDPGNSPNYFTLGFAVFFTTPNDLFPGLSREGLLRPPSIMPPAVSGRSADTFAELIHLLRGYPLHIKNETHRAELLRDCRYFHFKGLEQKIIRHHIGFNLSRQRSEITLRLEDVRQSGISVVGDPTASASETAGPGGLIGWVNYARPFVDDKSYDLILEIGDECTKIHLHTMRAEFFGEGKKRISRLFEVIATKLNLPTTQPLGLLMPSGGASSAPPSPGNTPISEDQVRIVLDRSSYVLLDENDHLSPGYIPSGTHSVSGGGYSISIEGSGSAGSSPESIAPVKKRRRGDMSGFGEESWIVRTGQWRLRVQNGRSGRRELGRNAKRMFLA
ncbi:hypothetical protein B0O99DRAFT_612125 [Bisporella sp. PMI_857]|nr:hypothetical protein B0O99DRAFT_612125 [Bisporella sp. PMI_857]